MRVTPERMKELEEWTAEHAEEIEEQRRQQPPQTNRGTLENRRNSIELCGKTNGKEPLKVMYLQELCRIMSRYSPKTLCA